jgi:hypothetical protein
VRLRPAWIKTSLRIRAVLSGFMLFAISFSTCNRVGKRTAWILIRLRVCAGWSGSMLVANPLCWFCYDMAQFCFIDPEEAEDFSEMVNRDTRKFKQADENGDGYLSKEEFASFLHPEEHEHMKDIVVLVSCYLYTCKITTSLAK